MSTIRLTSVAHIFIYSKLIQIHYEHKPPHISSISHHHHVQELCSMHLFSSSLHRISGRPLPRNPILGCHSINRRVHRSVGIFATFFAHRHLRLLAAATMSSNFVTPLIHSFVFLSNSRMPIAYRSIRRCAVANRFSVAFVSAHDSDPYSIVGTMQQLNRRRLSFIAMFLAVSRYRYLWNAFQPDRISLDISRLWLRGIETSCSR